MTQNLSRVGRAALAAGCARPDNITFSVRRWAEAAPKRAAIRHCGTELVYTDLVDAADGVAAALSERGIRTGETVGIVGSRSPGVVVAMIGVLQLGARVLLADTALPSVRRSSMLAAGGARGVVTIGGADHLGEHLLHVGVDGAVRSARSLPADPSPAASDGSAYVVFTSGSTATPRGVVGTHAGLMHFLDWQRDAVGVGSADRVSLLTGLSFDVVLRDILLPLTSGATLCIPGEQQAAGGRSLLDWLQSEAVTIAHVVPSLAATWLRDARSGESQDLRATFFAGEPLTDALVRRWRRSFPSSDVFNLYGPTETTLATCAYQVPHEPPPGVQPVGCPLPGTEVLVVDDAGRLCAEGKTGELVIRSPYRTLGYLSSDTGAGPCFRPDPVTGREHEPVYFSGDLGRWRNGHVEIVGRSDDQLKVRGVRVQPAEVAAVLERHAAVNRCIVVGDAANGRLVAFVVPRRRIEPAVLLAWARERLPGAMVPTELQWMDMLPLTPNGKVDRLALRARIAEPSPGTGGNPRTEKERRIAAVFEELLRCPGVGVDDDFFRLGGHSIAAVQAIARIGALFDVDLRVEQFFENPTIAGVAGIITHGRPGNRACASTDGATSGTVVDAPLAPAQRRFWFFHRLAPDEPRYHLPLSLRLVGQLDVDALGDALRRLLKRHSALRTAIVIDEGRPRQRTKEDLDVAVQLTVLAPGEADFTARLAALARADAAEPFDLANPPLFRARLVRISSRHHVLLLTFHHIITDGWSSVVFIRDLRALYAAAIRSRPAALAALTFDYLAYAKRCEDIESSDGYRTALAYWREALANAPPRLALPAPETSKFRPAAATATLSRATSNALTGVGNASDATPSMTLLAAWAMILSRWCHQTDLCIAVPVANRDGPEQDPAVGCFINLLVCRVGVDKQQTFGTLLRHVRDTMVGGLSNRIVPFDRLVAELGPRERGAAIPFVDALFNYLHLDFPDSMDASLTVERIHLVDLTSNVDLNLYWRWHAGQLTARLVYNAARFDERQGEALIRAYAAVLERLARDAGAKCGDYLLGLQLPAAAACERAVPTEPVQGHRDPDRSPVEAAVAAVWKRHLGASDIGRLDNFFDRGGHSLMAAELCVDLSRTFDRTLALRDFLNDPCVAAVAALIDDAGAQPARATTAQRASLTGELSFAQMAVWRNVGGPYEAELCNIPRAVSIEGELDTGLLETALMEVAERHRVLLCRFESHTAPRMVAGDASRLALRKLEAGGDAEVDEAFRREARHRFDVAAEPPLRAVLVRRAADSHVLIVTAHHLVADCWSMGGAYQQADPANGAWDAGIFFEELFDCYARGDQGRSARKPPPLQFNDLAAAERASADGGALDGDMAWWRRQLAGADGGCGLTPDKEGAAASCRGRRAGFAVPNRCVDDLGELARSESVSLYSVLLSAFMVQLHRWSGCNDILVATPVPARLQPETKGVIGNLGGTLVFRAGVEPHLPLRELVHAVHANVQEAQLHQLASIQELWAGRSPPFSARLILHRAPVAPARIGGLRLAPVRIDRHVAKHPFSLVLRELSTGWDGWCEYQSERFSSERIERVVAHYLALLDAVAAGLEGTVGDLPCP